MQVVEVVAGIVGFAIVAGYAGISWLRRGREPVFRDDDSILMPAPPPGMTAATATIVDGGPAQRAFVAALLDLASRDEIAFEEEGVDHGVGRVGIAIHGTETVDPQILLNRRQPIGEGETWLLAQLKAEAMKAAGELPGPGHELPPPELLQVGGQMMAAFLRATATASDDDSADARSAREHGLLAGPVPDLAALMEEAAARRGRPMSPDARQRLSGMESVLQLLADPAAIARDPDAVARQVEARAGRPLTDQEQAHLRQVVAAYAAQPAASAGPEYIPASSARELQAPLFFGTLLQSYATRHGWLAGLPILRRIRWRLTGAGEIVAGLLLAVAGSKLQADALTGLAGGVAAGGAATYLIAPAMAAKTPAGAEMKAQIAAYRRTLQMTFGQAQSLDEVVAARRLTWLDTPDQALVWGMALGLQRDIEALLARTGSLLAQGQGSASTYVPGWYSSIRRAIAASGPARDTIAEPRPVAAALHDPAAMFAGIEAIGSRTGRGVQERGGA